VPMTRTFPSACRHLVRAVLCAMFLPVLAVAEPIRVEITNYVVSVALLIGFQRRSTCSDCRGSSPSPPQGLSGWGLERL
jgi:hypothetical protein